MQHPTVLEALHTIHDHHNEKANSSAVDLYFGFKIGDKRKLVEASHFLGNIKTRCHLN
jgi:hypothetical protein